jgi:hypothetical protein
MYSGAVRALRKKKARAGPYTRQQLDYDYSDDSKARNRVAAAKYRKRKNRAYKDAVGLNEELYVKCKAMEVELRRVQDENLVGSLFRALL